MSDSTLAREPDKWRTQHLVIDSIYDRGSIATQEDLLVNSFPTLAVLDGVSGLYTPSEGPRKFDGRTGGRMVVDMIAEYLAAASPEEGLAETLLACNHQVREVQFDIADSPCLSGATGAIAKYYQNGWIEIAQWGDAMAFGETDDGEIHATVNQVLASDRILTEMRMKIFEELERLHPGEPRSALNSAMWDLYKAPAFNLKTRVVNTDEPDALGLLNGQPEFAGKLVTSRVSISNLRALLLVTDGMFDLNESADPRELGRTLLRSFKEGGLPGLLERRRTQERGQVGTDHVAYAEATGIGISVSL